MNTQTRKFAQVDVFSEVPYLGNPVAVVIEGDGLTDEQMQKLASWTNLSETTFILKPTTAEADYRLRIFTRAASCPLLGIQHLVRHMPGWKMVANQNPRVWWFKNAVRAW